MMRMMEMALLSAVVSMDGGCFGGGVLEARELSRNVAQARREAQCAAAVVVFLQQQQQCDESTSRDNSTRDTHNGCAILWRRCKVIDNAHARNAHAHTTTTRRSSNSSRSPWIPK